jgi:ribonucleoside-triphosphate reductase (formate)
VTRKKWTENGTIDVEEEVEVNTESAVEQLERYRMLMTSWCDHNVSITVSYDPEEIPAIADWLDRHWDDYVAVAFLLRVDPTKTAADLDFPYLPQEVVTETDWNAYSKQLKPIQWEGLIYHDAAPADACPIGGCPER